MWNWKSTLNTLIKWIAIIGFAVLPTPLLYGEMGKFTMFPTAVGLAISIVLYLLFSNKITRQHWTKKG